MNVVDVLPRDAIPPVYEPSSQPPAQYDGDPDDEVVVVERDGAVRGYPVRYLDYHEVVDDELGATPIAVTWCPLCGSVLVFDRRVGGETLTFGVSGKLADDTLVLYDHETDSEWKQSSGCGIAGPHEGTQLDVLPSTLTTYERFRDGYPDADLLAPPGGASEAASETDDPVEIDYDAETYDDYLDGEGFGLAARRPDATQRSFPLDWLDPKTVVVGLEHDGEAVAVARPTVEAADGVVTLTVGGTSVVVFAAPDGTHAYHDPGFDWRLADGLAHGDGGQWDPTTGVAVDADRRLSRFPAVRLFAYGWVDNHGPTAFYRG